MWRATGSCSVFVLVVIMILHRLSTAFSSRTVTIMSGFRMNHRHTAVAAATTTTTTTSNGCSQHQLSLLIETPDDMHDLGALLSQIATKRGDILLLDGDLGAGKTCLSRGFVQTMVGQEERVTSPTFLLCNSYPIVPLSSQFDAVNDNRQHDSGGGNANSPRM